MRHLSLFCSMGTVKYASCHILAWIFTAFHCRSHVVVGFCGSNALVVEAV